MSFKLLFLSGIESFSLEAHCVCILSFGHQQVNLKYGIHHPSSNAGTESDTCTACAGTMIMEFGALSRLTGEPLFEVQYYNFVLKDMIAVLLLYFGEAREDY